MNMPRNEKEMEIYIKQMLTTLERWVREGRLTKDELERFVHGDPDIQGKVQQLIAQDQYKQVRRDAFAEELGFRYGCWIIGGIIAIVVGLLSRGC